MCLSTRSGSYWDSVLRPSSVISKAGTFATINTTRRPSSGGLETRTERQRWPQVPHLTTLFRPTKATTCTLKSTRSFSVRLSPLAFIAWIIMLYYDFLLYFGVFRRLGSIDIAHCGCDSERRLCDILVPHVRR